MKRLGLEMARVKLKRWRTKLTRACNEVVRLERTVARLEKAPPAPPKIERKVELVLPPPPKRPGGAHWARMRKQREGGGEIVA